MKTLLVSGSIRSVENHSLSVYDCAFQAISLDDYIERIKSLQGNGKSIANSDILAGAVVLAMHLNGADVDFFPLMKLFPKKERGLLKDGESELASRNTLSLNEGHFAELKDKIKSADGIVLSTPVYFGDRSSVANKLLQLSGIHNLIEDKVFGTVAVGAKRNGGQETTTIYSLFEALNQNALIVGNGPPTSQYGGTAVGGKRGTVINDPWGLETAYGTGLRVSQVSNIFCNGRESSLARPVEILVLVTMDDTKKSLYDYLHLFLKRAKKQHSRVEFTVVNVLEKTIHRCLGCEVCPASGLLEVGELPSAEKHAHCIISASEDSMEEIHEQLLGADGIIIAGLNVKNHDQLIYRYQAMMERTRYIRRNNFELTDKLMTSFTLSQVGAKINSLHALKTLTSYIRHNSIMHKPIESYVVEGQVVEEGMEDLLHFIRSAEAIAVGKNLTVSNPPKYTTEGIGGY